MAITLEELRRLLNVDEPDYRQIVAKIDAAAIPFLATLAQDPDKMLASKAVYLAGLFPDPGAHQIVDAAASSTEPLLKIAAASAMAHVPDPVKNRIAEKLIDEDNLSIQKLVIQAIPKQASPQLQQKLTRLSQESPNEAIRTISKSTLSKFNK